ncbi:MAG: ATP-binding protein [Actinomycetota bacterium]|nr:DUF4118 domain-containing protein [Actinomycetota bacterium]
MLRIRSLSPPSTATSVLFASIGPGIAIGLGLAIDRRSLVGATSLCLLAVVVAAAFGGLRSGLAASVVAFLSLNLFFTEPYHTFGVRRLADLIALLVFLAVSTVVGALLSQAIEERERAERRVTEAAFLDRITSRLISGEQMDVVLGEFARDLVEMFDLAGCEIRLTGGAFVSVGAIKGDGPRLEVQLGRREPRGSVAASRKAGASGFGPTERSFLQALAAQAALALERASLDQEVSRAQVDAEASRLRAALFSSVTHDLRTPLASIKASASGLLDNDVAYSAEQREETLRTVVEEADRLNRIVGNLLDLARMRAGVLLPSREEVWIQDLINAVLARMRRRLEGFSVRVTLRQDLPPVEGDAMQLDQVLTNILENAARFSPPGGEILLTAARWQDSVQVRVADQGPGIPAHERTDVFEEFYRKDAGRGRGGTGLGLAIARAIIVAHGGNINAEGAPGGGTAIVFHLPVAKTENAGAALEVHA